VVDDIEDVTTHVPMISRILHLLVIDILAVGVALRRGSTEALAQPAAAVFAGTQPGGRRGRDQTRSGPGISTAAPLSHLTSHSR